MKHKFDNYDVAFPNLASFHKTTEKQIFNA
jgi:hypothetical protein